MTKIQNLKRLDHLKIVIWILPFDLAQGGELVEPFRVSSFGFPVYPG